MDWLRSNHVGTCNTRARNNRTSIGRQRSGKHAFITLQEAVFSMWSAPHILTRDTCFPRGPGKVGIRSVRQGRGGSRRSTEEYRRVVESSRVESSRVETNRVESRNWPLQKLQERNQTVPRRFHV
jgi:hypothetical protein